MDAWTIRNPFTRGQSVLIPAGTVVHSTNPGRGAFVVGRTYRVTVHHLLSGWVDALGVRGVRGGTVLPMITWAGTGGYWMDAQVTPELLAKNGLDVLVAPVLQEKETRALKVTPDPNGPHTDRWGIPKTD